MLLTAVQICKEELAEVLRQRAAISEVLRAIANSPHDLQPIFDTPDLSDQGCWLHILLGKRLHSLGSRTNVLRSGIRSPETLFALGHPAQFHGS
jgi:hypothetical protein